MVFHWLVSCVAPCLLSLYWPRPLVLVLVLLSLSTGGFPLSTGGLPLVGELLLLSLVAPFAVILLSLSRPLVYRLQSAVRVESWDSSAAGFSPPGGARDCDSVVSGGVQVWDVLGLFPEIGWRAGSG